MPSLALPKSSRKTIRRCEVTNKVLASRFARVRDSAHHRASAEEWLLIDRPADEKAPTNFCLWHDRRRRCGHCVNGALRGLLKTNPARLVVNAIASSKVLPVCTYCGQIPCDKQRALRFAEAKGRNMR